VLLAAAAAGKPKFWTCGACGEGTNWYNRAVCYHCKAPRAASGGGAAAPSAPPPAAAPPAAAPAAPARAAAPVNPELIQKGILLVLRAAKKAGVLAMTTRDLRERVASMLPSLAAKVSTEAAFLAQLRCLGGVKWSLSADGCDNLLSTDE